MVDETDELEDGNFGDDSRLLTLLITSFYRDKRVLGRVSVCLCGVFGNFI